MRLMPCTNATDPARGAQARCRAPRVRAPAITIGSVCEEPSRIGLTTPSCSRFSGNGHAPTRKHKRRNKGDRV